MWNGSLDKPTFQPSLLVRSGHHGLSHQPGDDCWCTFKARGGDTSFSCYLCHSFIREGRIEFLTDCTHPLAGQTVDLPDIQEDP